MVEDRLEAAAQQMPKNPETGEYDDWNKRMANALVEVCATADGEMPVLTTMLHTDASALLGRDGYGVSELQSGPVISNEMARMLSCDCDVELIFEDDGTPVGIGRESRKIPAWLRRQVIGRDHRCRFPGCARTAFLHPSRSALVGGRSNRYSNQKPPNLNRHDYRLEHMFVLGIDPGLSSTGYGLVEGSHPPRAIRAGVIRTDTDLTLPRRLADLHAGLLQVIADADPDVIAMETVFTNRNLQTAMSVGRASGVALLAAAEAGLDVHEYVPTAIKAAVTGDGSAKKDQVQQMVARLLRLAEAPKPADASDALAIALCHLRVAPLEASK